MNYTPLKMQPCYQEYLWGGTRLKKEYGKNGAPSVTAGSWELANHEAGKSTVADGEWEGKDLADLAALDKQGFWGTDCKSDTFPLLVKLIDAEKDLSIQVHPSDETADREKGEQGKAEMWYIVDCKPQSFIYYGFAKEISREEFYKKAQDGTICDVLNKVPVKKGDVFYILPGTIHAICAGILIAEIQQNSNTTFRVYDYQRRGADGNLRQLHLDRAAQVTNFQPVIPSECRANSSASFSGFCMTEMFSCRYFKSYCLTVDTKAELCCDGKSFQHIVCVEGEAIIQKDGKSWSIKKGDSYFLPAALNEYEIIGKCRVLLSRV